MLYRREFVVVFPLGPRHPRASVHHRLVGSIESVGGSRALAATLPLTPHLGVLAPQLISGRPLVDKLCAFALPRRMTHPVEQPVSQVVRTNHRDGGKPGNLLAGTGQPEDCTG